MKKMSVSSLVMIGLCIAFSMVLSFIESQFPPFIAIPGIKIGMANIAVVFILYKMGWKQAVLVSIIRVMLSSVLFGQAVSLLYSLAGAVLSLSGMILIKKTDRFSSITVSVAGGVLHNVGQIVAACLITETKQLLLYLPVLLITGTISGIVIGLTAGLLNKRIEKLKI